jgi:hypothetical protein
LDWAWGPRYRDVVGGVDVRLGAEELIDRFQIVPVRGPEQRGGAVRPCRVDVDSLGEQGAVRLTILCGGGLDQPHVLLGGGRRAPRCQH